MTPKGLMASRNVAATVYQVSYATISNWEKKRPKEFYRIMGDKTKPA
jgi:hypothetical protein